MTLNGWAQIALFIAILLVLTRPLGGYLSRVMEGQRTFLSPVLGTVERRMDLARARQSYAYRGQPFAH